MSKERVGNMRNDKFVFEAGSNYRFKVMDFKVISGEKTPGGYPLVVVDVMCIGGEQYKEVLGRRAELSFSMSPKAKGIAGAWLRALGYEDNDEVETTDATELEGQLRSDAKGAIIMCNIQKEKRGDYWQNSVTPPWEVYLAMEAEADYKGGDDEEKAPF